jgi:hypothetical protein
MCTAKYSQHYRKSTIQNPKKDPASSIQQVKISNSRLQPSEKNSRLIVSHQKKKQINHAKTSMLSPPNPHPTPNPQPTPNPAPHQTEREEFNKPNKERKIRESNIKI